MLKIFTGSVPENPYPNNIFQAMGKPIPQNRTKCDAFFEGQQSILNQCKEVDLNKAYKDYAPRNLHKRFETVAGVIKEVPFEQFIMEQMK